MSPKLKTHFVLFSICCLLAVFSAGAFAQDKLWRDVTPAELQAKTPQVEDDADAEAIFWEVRIDDSNSSELSLSHYVRVKIYNERGREKFSKIDVPYYKGKKVKDITARIIKADGSIIEIKKEDVFDREIAKANGLKIKAKSFAVPNIEPGVIIEYRYREIFGYGAGAAGMHLEFQRDIPVQTLSYYYKPFNKTSPNYQSFNFSDTKFVEDDKGYFVASRKNIPAFKEEPRMPPEDQVRPWMLLQTLRVRYTETFNSIQFIIKDPNNPSTYWAAVASERAGFAKLLNAPAKEVKKAAEEVAGTASTPEDKLRKIYAFCQTQIRNTSYDPSLTDEQKEKLPENKSIADILKRKSGSGSEVDYLFASMVSALGFDVRPAYTANRSEMFFERNMTNDSFLHRGAIAVKVGDEFKFFSPGSGFLPYGMLMWHDEDVWALLVGADNYYWVKTPLTAKDKTVSKRTGKFKLSEDGTLEGTVRIEYSGQRGFDYKMGNYDQSDNQREEDLREAIKKQFNTAEVSDITVANVTDTEKPFVYTFKIRVPNYAQKTGKRLFLQPGFFEYGIDPEFKTATRTHDIYFVYPWAEQDNIEISMPPNFSLENAEQPNTVMDKGKVGMLEIKIGYDKPTNTLIYNRNFYFGGGNNLSFPADLYQPLKNLFDSFHKADSHTLTLKQN